jgi:hypothetical protein
MLRISTIATLAFYITISIGVHLDIDTCCQSIAGVSVSSESDEHGPSDQNCCAAMQSSCCSSEEEEACSLDCIYVQILSEEQLVSNPPRVEISMIELFIGEFDLTYVDSTTDVASEVHINDPPDIQLEEQLHLNYHSLLTYG